MSFIKDDFSKIDSIKFLNELLIDRSYIENSRSFATQVDVEVYERFQTQYPNFTRWFNHIGSFSEEFSKLPVGSEPIAATTAAPAAAVEKEEEEVNFFSSDDNEEESIDEASESLKQQRIAEEYSAKRALKGPKKKPAAKSIIIMDIKPWDDESDLDALLHNVLKITIDGLIWGQYQWIPIGFGIKKLQINLVVEDDKVSIVELQQQIEEQDEDHVQSTDVVAMQKL